MARNQNRAKRARLVVERLEERSLMSVSGGLTATVDGPFTAVAPIAIDVVANDTTTNPGAIIIVSITQGANGTVSLNGDNTLTYSPNSSAGIPDDIFSYTVTDGTDTASAAV